MLKLVMKWLRRLLIGFLALLLVVGVGRLVQLSMDSHISGARAPYLQMQAADAITLRWQTEADEVGLVRYGRSPDRLDKRVSEAEATDLHELRITGLQPATRYWYALGTESELRYGGTAEHWFETAPKQGQSMATRFWVLGDPGYPKEPLFAVSDAAEQWWEENPREGRPNIDLILTTGDNAYRSGTNEQFEKGFFVPFAKYLRNTPVWPVYGNHDDRRWTFYDLFTFPTQGESGGVPSGSEHYYSFDYGPVHMVMLDSQSIDRDKDSAMAEWLRRDLAANRQPWLIALFHHPTYTKGSHNSDNLRDSRGRMFEMRENILPILERGGVDLVLTGHSHMYERSHLITGHYGPSAHFKPGMILDKGQADEWSIQYKKACGEKEPARGTIYAVVGSSSKLDQGPLDHPAMPISLRQYGSLMIDVEGAQMTLRFINAEGFVSDEAVLKKVPAPQADGSGICP